MRKQGLVSAIFGLCLHASGAFGDQSFENQLAICQSCHMSTVVENDPKVPEIRGQHFFYTYTQLKDYKSDRRAHPIMSPMVAGLDKAMMKQLAQYFSEQEWTSRPVTQSPEDEKAAESLLVAGQCIACHGNFQGLNGTPRLAGQKSSYLQETLNALKNKTRMNAASMSSIVSDLSDDDIKALSDYMSNR